MLSDAGAAASFSCRRDGMGPETAPIIARRPLVLPSDCTDLKCLDDRIPRDALMLRDGSRNEVPTTAKHFRRMPPRYRNSFHEPAWVKTKLPVLYS